MDVLGYAPPEVGVPNAAKMNTETSVPGPSSHIIGSEELYLVDRKKEEEEEAIAASGQTSASPHHITTIDYADRQKLLFHITLLSTKLQRAQLRLQEQDRGMVILRAAAASCEVKNGGGGSVSSQQKREALVLANTLSSVPYQSSPSPGSRVGVSSEGNGGDHESGDHSQSLKESQEGDGATERGGQRYGDGDAAPLTSQGEGEDVVLLRLHARGATATALRSAAATEEEATRLAEAQLSLFDPQLAEEQIRRLDVALAQMSLLQESSQQRAMKSETACEKLRGERTELCAQVQALEAQCTALSQVSQQQRAALASATIEVERLRLEEVRLNRRLVGLEDLAAPDNVDSAGVRVVTSERERTSSNSGRASHNATTPSRELQRQQSRNGHDTNVDKSRAAARRALEEEEATSRQTLLSTELFWEPMLIAFDAGLTWLTDSQSLAMVQNNNNNDNSTFQRPCDNDVCRLCGRGGVGIEKDGGDGDRWGRPSQSATDDRNVGLEVATAVVALAGAESDGTAIDAALSLAAPTGSAAAADLLLLQHQRQELQSLRGQLATLQSRARADRVECERLRAVCAAQRRQVEGAGHEHVQQLQRMYEELVKDRQLVMENLLEEVARKVKRAFRDGQQHEREKRQQLVPLSVPAAADGTAVEDREQTQQQSTNSSARAVHQELVGGRVESTGTQGKRGIARRHRHHTNGESLAEMVRDAATATATAARQIRRPSNETAFHLRNLQDTTTAITCDTSGGTNTSSTDSSDDDGEEEEEVEFERGRDEARDHRGDHDACRMLTDSAQRRADGRVRSKSYGAVGRSVTRRGVH